MDDIDTLMMNANLMQQELLRSEIEQIQVLVMDLVSAVKVNDVARRNKIFSIIMQIVKIKGGELPTLKEYFKGQKISRYRAMIDESLAIEYALKVMQTVRDKSDWRVKPTKLVDG